MSTGPDGGGLDLFMPYAATTRGVTVRVAVSFLPEQADVARGRWFWSYHIRISNGGDDAVQLLTRHWLITDGDGVRHRVEGDGVIGEQPVIAPGAAYDYVSGCPLETPSGAMQGQYGMVDEAGDRFMAAIPRFVLAAPVDVA